MDANGLKLRICFVGTVSPDSINYMKPSLTYDRQNEPPSGLSLVLCACTPVRGCAGTHACVCARTYLFKYLCAFLPH